MNRTGWWRRITRMMVASGIWIPWGALAERVTLATYNLENYVLEATGNRAAKSEESKAKVAQVLKSIQADIVALQEVGGREALEDLCRRMADLGWPFPHREWIQGHDTNIQVSLISRHPIVSRRPHTRDSYLLSGRRFQVSRGILEVDVKVNPAYTLTVLAAHLKSRRPIPDADEGEMRLEEARILRGKIDARLRESPQSNLVVLGDLNDTKDSPSIRALMGKGRGALVDSRPSERNGDTGYTPNPRWQPRTVAWTHYYGVEDTYGRVDYVLLHPNVAREWLPALGYVPNVPDWGKASDHRPVVVVVESVDR